MGLFTRFDEQAFGKVLYSKYAIYPYYRIPRLFSGPRYFLTTKGLVIKGGKKGLGDLLKWERIVEPGVLEGHTILGLDISGCITFNTLTTLGGKDGNKQEFPQMPTEFYRKLMQAWNIANMFKDKDVSNGNRDIALQIWQREIWDNTLKTREYYLDRIYAYKITTKFGYNSEYQKIAMFMYKKGLLKEKDIDEKKDSEIIELIDKYIENQNDNQNLQGNNPQNDDKQIADLRNGSQKIVDYNKYGLDRRVIEKLAEIDKLKVDPEQLLAAIFISNKYSMDIRLSLNDPSDKRFAEYANNGAELFSKVLKGEKDCSNLQKYIAYYNSEKEKMDKDQQDSTRKKMSKKLKQPVDYNKYGLDRKAIEELAKDFKEKKGENLSAEEYLAVFQLSYDTGLRLSEVTDVIKRIKSINQNDIRIIEWANRGANTISIMLGDKIHNDHSIKYKSIIDLYKTKKSEIDSKAPVNSNDQITQGD